MEYDSYEEDYYSYEEDFNSSLMEEDCSQMFHREQLQEMPPSPPPSQCPDDPDIIFSQSIKESKKLLENALGYPTKALKIHRPHGLVVIPLECFNALRVYDGPPRRPIPHFIWKPSSDQSRLNHPDFQTALALIYQNEQESHNL